MTDRADLPERVARVEASVVALSRDLAGLADGQRSLGDKLDEIVTAVTSTDARSADRTTAVKSEFREESERKARDKSDLFKNGIAFVGGISVIVAAIGGPYLNKLNATSSGQEQNTRDLSSVRELIASDHAEIMRNRDATDIAREKNRWQDEHLFSLTERQAYDEGANGRPPPAR